MQNAEGKYYTWYPKAFYEEICFKSGSFPLYRRRDNRRRLYRNSIVYNNRNIMPYSPYLSIRYNTYINIEVALNINIFKYLYKYVYKGPDRIAAVIDRKIVDKIKEYINTR